MAEADIPLVGVTMYEDHYGFRGEPFAASSDPRFWFDSAAQRKVMSYVGYGLSHGEGIIVVTGAGGSGKTLLVSRLLASIDRERFHIVSVAATRIERGSLLRDVAIALGVAHPAEDRTDVLAAIEHASHAIGAAGRRPLLIIDEAEALPMKALEELRLLSNIMSGSQALLQLFLLGQPEFKDMLEASGRLEQLRQRVIVLQNLDPLVVEEVEPYMAHCLALVGWNGGPRFTGDAFDALHHESGGIPQRLNMLAANVLRYGAARQVDIIDEVTVAAAIADLARDRRHVRAPSDPLEQHNEQRIEWPPTAAPRPEALAEAMADEQARLELMDLAARVTALEELPDPAEHPVVAQVPDLATRIATIEARLEDQDAALRRVLMLLVDWVEADRRPAVPTINLRA